MNLKDSMLKRGTKSIYYDFIHMKFRKLISVTDECFKDLEVGDGHKGILGVDRKRSPIMVMIVRNCAFVKHI